MNEQDILNRLRIIRTIKGTSQKMMAQAIGCNKNEYTQKEKGTIPVTTEEWLKIAKTLDVPVESFFMNIPFDTVEESKFLLYGFNRLTSRGRMIIMALLDALLRAQWSEFRTKMHTRRKGTKRKTSDGVLKGLSEKGLKTPSSP